MTSTVLLVEDDPQIRDLVAALLCRYGFEVHACTDSTEMDAALMAVRADLLVLDIGLPGEDGLLICRRLRAQNPTLPILMLTARSDEVDRVVGLEMGADDYLVKPFGTRELIARVRALLRRGDTIASHSSLQRYKFGSFTIDLGGRELRHDTAGLIALTDAEFSLLTCFVLRPRRVLTRDEITESTRGWRADPADRTVDMLVSRLRRKLDAAEPDARLITTVRNGGYLFTMRPEAAHAGS